MTGGRSGRALDWLNFFTANVQTGFGPFVVVYLTTQSWTEVQIGVVLSIGTATMMLCQVPAGMLVDATPRKRLAALVAILCIAFSALLMVIWPSYLPVLGSQVLHGVASCVLTPAIAAISLALVGRVHLGERLGRNARFGALGSGIAAAVMGAVGAWFSAGSVFWLTAALTIPSLVALAAIRGQTLHPPPVQPVAGVTAHEGGLRTLLLDRGVLVFAGCAMLFTLSNAALLPLAGTEITRNAGDYANLVIAACIVVPQLVMCAIAPWVGRLTESRGRRLVLLAGLGALPLRALLMGIIENPFGIAAVQALDGISAAALGVLVPLLAADLTRGSNRFNLCMALFGLSMGLGGTISTTLAGAIASWVGVGAAFAFLTAAGFLGFLLAALAMPETREASTLPAAPQAATGAP
ncbi:MFS transporter [Roseomonas sp. ACRSG]|nr:MFS transporter [Roseomonas sp. ACRSG]